MVDGGCGLRAPLVTTVAQALADPTFEQAIVFITNYVQSIRILSTFLALLFISIFGIILRYSYLKYTALALFVGLIGYLVYDYLHPSVDFIVTYPKPGQTILLKENAYGTKVYEGTCKWVILYIKTHNLDRPYRIIDSNPIDGVGTWSLKLEENKMLEMLNERITLYIGLSKISPHAAQLKEESSIAPDLEFVRTLEVYISRQALSEPAN
jgi:hypothetical protein